MEAKRCKSARESDNNWVFFSFLVKLAPFWRISSNNSFSRSNNDWSISDGGWDGGDGSFLDFFGFKDLSGLCCSSCWGGSCGVGGIGVSWDGSCGWIGSGGVGTGAVSCGSERGRLIIEILGFLSFLVGGWGVESVVDDGGGVGVSGGGVGVVSAPTWSFKSFKNANSSSFSRSKCWKSDAILFLFLLIASILIFSSASLFTLIFSSSSNRFNSSSFAIRSLSSRRRSSR